VLEREGGVGGDDVARSQRTLRDRMERWEGGGGDKRVAGSLRVCVERWEGGRGGDEVAEPQRSSGRVVEEPGSDVAGSVHHTRCPFNTNSHSVAVGCRCERWWLVVLGGDVALCSRARGWCWPEVPVVVAVVVGDAAPHVCARGVAVVV
jgi:hypothetical protein